MKTISYEKLLDEMCYGNKNMVICGGAGSGKSTLIKKMQEKQVNALYVAPSGIAALNIHGLTIHSLFKLRPTIQTPKHQENLMNVLKPEVLQQREMIRNANILLIDEISMVRCDLFDKIDSELQYIRGSHACFGGMRIILVGDLFQLGPVANRFDAYNLKKMYNQPDFSFYNSNVWRNHNDFIQNMQVYELTHNYRQREDTDFGALLNNIRIGLVDDTLLDSINTRTQYNPQDDTFHYLTVTNEKADQINRQALQLLPGNLYCSISNIQPPLMRIHHLVKKCPVNKSLIIKKDMKIMFVMNDSAKKGKRWVNGTIGKVISIQQGVSPGSIQSVKIAVKGTLYEVGREHYEIFSAYYDGTEKRCSIQKIAKVEQFPFVPAWASTIDKCQGLTLEKVKIDFGENVFRAGQVYVALSRAKKLSDIFLERPIRKEDIIVSPQVKYFFHSLQDTIIRVSG